jgi:hypothetical protein
MPAKAMPARAGANRRDERRYTSSVTSVTNFEQHYARSEKPAGRCPRKLRPPSPAITSSRRV